MEGKEHLAVFHKTLNIRVGETNWRATLSVCFSALLRKATACCYSRGETQSRQAAARACRRVIYLETRLFPTNN